MAKDAGISSGWTVPNYNDEQEQREGHTSVNKPPALLSCPCRLHPGHVYERSSESPQQSVIISATWLTLRSKSIVFLRDAHTLPPPLGWSVKRRPIRLQLMPHTFISHSVDVKCHRSLVMHAISSVSKASVPSALPANLSSSNNMD